MPKKITAKPEVKINSGRWSLTQIEENLIEKADRWRRWGGFNRQELSDSEKCDFDEDLHQFDHAVRRAIRAGITDNVYVQRWLTGMRSVGDYDYLRNLKVGAEKGTVGSIDRADCWIAFHAHDLAAAGKTLKYIWAYLNDRIKDSTTPDWLPSPVTDEEFRRELTARLRTKENTRKRLKCLGIRTGDGKSDT